MADEVDIASEAQLRQEAAFAAALERWRQAGPAAELCEECGEPIPAARREAVPGCCLCVDCAEAAERSLRRVAGTR